MVPQMSTMNERKHNRYQVQLCVGKRWFMGASWVLQNGYSEIHWFHIFPFHLWSVITLVQVNTAIYVLYCAVFCSHLTTCIVLHEMRNVISSMASDSIYSAGVLKWCAAAFIVHNWVYFSVLFNTFHCSLSSIAAFCHEKSDGWRSIIKVSTPNVAAVRGDNRFHSNKAHDTRLQQNLWHSRGRLEKNNKIILCTLDDIHSCIHSSPHPTLLCCTNWIWWRKITAITFHLHVFLWLPGSYFEDHR